MCSWLQQLDSPACVELVPLSRHHGINGSVLRKLNVKMLVELGVREMTALVLLDARDRIPTAADADVETGAAQQQGCGLLGVPRGAFVQVFPSS